tara:strand:- start:78 stop:311 length:234 start_codon:yes stop_codon:yes gene_type:complete
MSIIIIPKKIVKGEELIAIPKKEYEEYLRFRSVIPVVKMTVAEKREWQQAKKDYKHGKYITIEKLQNELGIARKRKS